jgi:hypothetical protein
MICKAKTPGSLLTSGTALRAFPRKHLLSLADSFAFDYTGAMPIVGAAASSHYRPGLDECGFRT